METRLPCFVALVSAAVARTPAQDPGEVSRVYCDDADPANRCPGDACRCVDETLEVTFDGVSQSVLELPDPGAITGFGAIVVMDVKSPVVQGWSYGVEHDGSVLKLDWLTLVGMDGYPEGDPPCCFEWEGRIESCEEDPDPACPNPGPASGFVSAIILSFIQPRVLEVRRNTLVRASYRLVSDPGPAGTLIQVVDHLRLPGYPPTRIEITQTGRSRRPRLLIDGLVRRAAPRFRRGDLDGSGRLSIADIVGLLQAAAGGRPPPLDCEDLLDADDDGHRTVTDAIPLLQYLFQRGPAPPEPFLACGVDPTPGDPLGCAQSSCR